MTRVAVIDCGTGNLGSVVRAFEECGGAPVVTDREADVRAASHVVLPGVGAFGDVIVRLRARRLDEILAEHVLVGQRPFLGICLGMQLLATTGTEGGAADGLGWIDGEVCRLTPTADDPRVPHIGWSEVFPAGDPPVFHGIEPGRDFYFVHSYHLHCQRDEQVLARTPAHGGFVSAVGRGNVLGVQFHPEKSQRAGFQLLKNFLSL